MDIRQRFRDIMDREKEKIARAAREGSDRMKNPAKRPYGDADWGVWALVAAEYVAFILLVFLDAEVGSSFTTISWPIYVVRWGIRLTWVAVLYVLYETMLVFWSLRGAPRLDILRKGSFLKRTGFGYQNVKENVMFMWTLFLRMDVILWRLLRDWDLPDDQALAADKDSGAVFIIFVLGQVLILTTFGFRLGYVLLSVVLFFLGLTYYVKEKNGIEIPGGY